MNAHILQVFWYELKRNVRRKGFLFTTFGIPLIAGIALVVSQAFIGGDDSNRNLERLNQATDTLEDIAADTVSDDDLYGYVDQSGLFPAPTENPDGEAVNLIRYETEDAATAAMEAGDIEQYYVVAEDYLETGRVIVVSPRFSFGALNTEPIAALMLRTLAEEADPALVRRLSNPANIEDITIADETSEGEANVFEGKFVLVYFFAMALMISTFATNGYLMQTVIEEKETRLIEILIASVRPVQLLTGKILALGLLGLMQVVMWFIAGFVLLRLSIEFEVFAALFGAIQIPFEILPLVLVYFVLLYLLFAAFYGAIGALSTSMQEGPQYAVVLTLPALLPLYFTFLFVGAPNGVLPTVLSMIPPMSAMAMVLRLVVTDVPIWQVVLSMGLLGTTAMGMVWLAGRLFRVNTLLAGQRPGLRDVARLVRG